MTRVCKTSTALLKKSIFYVPESFLYGFYDGNRKAGMLMAGGGVALIGMILVPLLKGLFG